MSESKIISRIQKLLALAQSGNVHEAEAAAAAGRTVQLGAGPALATGFKGELT